MAWSIEKGYRFSLQRKNRLFGKNGNPPLLLKTVGIEKGIAPIDPAGSA